MDNNYIIFLKFNINIPISIVPLDSFKNPFLASKELVTL